MPWLEMSHGGCWPGMHAASIRDGPSVGRLVLGSGRKVGTRSWKLPRNQVRLSIPIVTESIVWLPVAADLIF